MSNLPSNPYNSVFGTQMSTNSGSPMFNQQINQVPSSQLPPGYNGINQDAAQNNSSPKPLPAFQNSVVQGEHLYNHSHSASSSPAFNRPGVMQPSSLQASPLRPPFKPAGMMPTLSQINVPPQNITLSSTTPLNVSSSLFTSSQYPPNFSSPQISVSNTLSPIPSSQYNKTQLNGPIMPGVHSVIENKVIPGNSSIITQPPLNQTHYGPRTITSTSGQYLGLSSDPHISKPPLPIGQSKMPVSGSSQSNLSSNNFAGISSTMPAPHVNSHPILGGSAANQGNTAASSGPIGPFIGPGGTLSHPPMSTTGVGPLQGPLLGQVTSGPPNSQMFIRPPVTAQPIPSYSYSAAQNGPSGPIQSGPTPMPQNRLPSGPQSLGGIGQQSVMPQSALYGPPSGPACPPSNTNLQNRYPQIPQGNYINHQVQQPNTGRQYPQQYDSHGLTQQMGQLSVTKQGFDQLWGHQMIDLLQCKQILPEYPENPPEIKLGHQFADSPNCSPEIFRSTINRVPETNSLLQKSRLPFGILIHPFKDLNHLPVIQCTTIVRCRACRTYINPFVYFVDAKRWKCNLCYRVNDLPEEFQYDPVSKSYGDPSRRPEIKSATIEFIAPGEYMLRPPQPAVYLFLLDVSHIARESGYIQVFCETLKSNLDQIPGDARTQIGFICYDSHIHYYLINETLTRPKEMTVLDIDDVFLPSPESLLVNLGECRELINDLLTLLPQRYSGPGVPSSALGAALQAAYKLMAPTGGRITVVQTCLPNVGPGGLQSREDPNARSSKEVAHLNPATDFYKRLALDCSGAQIAVDLFLLNSQYSDLATLSGMSKFSGGTVYHIPLFLASRQWQADLFQRMLTRYLTRKIGFEAVMRVRCTRGITIHTFHGNFFVRSTDLLSLPNVSPDAGFGMQLTIEESLSDLQQVCFQAALLYTSSKGERRIRVHTMALPIAGNLTDVLHSADQQCIVGLLSKMAVDRCASASMSEAREALTNVAVDALSAHRLAQNLPAGTVSSALHAPASLRLLPLYLAALLKRKAFRTGTSTRLDDRVADMCALKTMPLPQLLRSVYPDLYPIHQLEGHTPDPPRLHLTAERINSNGAYLLDDGETMIIYVCHDVSPAFLSDVFGVAAFSQLPDEARSLPLLETDGNEDLQAFIMRLNDERPFPSDILILRDNSPNRQIFTERLVDDRVESAFSYYEFLQHVKTQVK